MNQAQKAAEERAQQPDPSKVDVIGSTIVKKYDPAIADPYRASYAFLVLELGEICQTTPQMRICPNGFWNKTWGIVEGLEYSNGGWSFNQLKRIDPRSGSDFIDSSDPTQWIKATYPGLLDGWPAASPPSLTPTSPGPFRAIHFGTNVEDGRIIGESTAFPASTTQVCALWEYSGMQNGADWGRVWKHEGEVVVDKRSGAAWDDGSSGTAWVCFSDDNGLSGGSWELLLYVGNQEVQRGGFSIAGGQQPPAGVRVAIWTDQTYYAVGDTIRLCFSAPASYIVITDFPPFSEPFTVYQGNEDGTGGCFTGAAVPPGGWETVRIDVYIGGALAGSAETRFYIAE